MIEKHYGRANVVAEELEELISEADESAARSQATPSQTRSPPEAFEVDERRPSKPKKETPDESGASVRAGDRGGTGDVQLGKRKKVFGTSSRKR